MAAGVNWLGSASDNQAMAVMMNDGKYVADADQFSEVSRVLIPPYSIAGLAVVLTL